MRGNAIELRDTSNGPRKSYLFFLTIKRLEIRLSGEEAVWLGKHCTFAVSGAHLMVLENLRDLSSHPRAY
jgi:hypothetical protein